MIALAVSLSITAPKLIMVLVSGIFRELVHLHLPVTSDVFHEFIG
jgi:hypothetical protein